MMTYQKPVTFSINVLLPELTLRYCCSVRQNNIQICILMNELSISNYILIIFQYVSNALSIFTTLRAVVEVT